MFTFSIYRVFPRFIHIGMTLLIFSDLIAQSISVATNASFSSLMSAIDTRPCIEFRFCSRLKEDSFSLRTLECPCIRQL
ncbi:hypothetical protein BDV34DRAFT_205409 [Aspergillus parasiticus]|uniref:Uncharacterized protein n=1 Tax=Aspergillus parasiticus TaxID=5067 RepID=A0A5N6D7X7_ASPPA|nr:hypothetical protein BDV34DRAFT_205409 [Aspergillus parasiticus]